MKILLTSFDPFGTDSENSSREAVSHIPDAPLGDAVALSRYTLPVSFARAPEILSQLVASERPDIILMTGQAARPSICLERTARNWVKSLHGDIDGFLSPGQQISPSLPDELHTSLPVESIAPALAAAGHPVAVSRSAGTFVCNRLYFHPLHTFPSLPSLFVHLPLTPSQASRRPDGTPSLPSADAAAALTALISLLTSTR